MAKSSLARLRKRYGDFENYKDLCERIIVDNHSRTAKKISRINNEVFTAERARTRSKGKAVNLPELADILPRHIELVKSKDHGKWMAENLRAKITSDLRSVLKNPEYARTRGKMVGQLKEKAVSDFQKRILKTFENYTKIDPKIGVPSNIRNIAVTEVRTVVNNTREAYMNELLRRNNDLRITKTWIHNARASKKPRLHHREMNGVTVNKAEAFIMHNSDTGKTVRAMYPHDPRLPPEEVIGCSCEVVYRVSKLEKGAI